MLYDLIDSLSGQFAVSTLCSVLEATGPPGRRTAYYRYKSGGSYQPQLEGKKKSF